MYLYFFFYLFFIHASLFIPGYVFVKKRNFLNENLGLQICFAYVTTIVIFASLATVSYALKVSPNITRVFSWVIILYGFISFFKDKLYRKLLPARAPIICAVLLSVLATAFTSLTYAGNYTYLPEPTARLDRNYQVLAVKILNVAQTPAIDNYIPYRQAQFFINRSNPATDSFISEWGVHFFQRTPLMGAVTANYFNLFDDSVPIDHSWSNTSADPDHSYAKFQILSSVLNSIFLVPGYFLLRKLFNKKTALISCLFLTTSQLFLYNAIFSWPKSFVAFFILISWLLILEKQMRLTLLAGVVSGIAYLTHDLAVLYIGASVAVLVLNKRFKEMFVYVGASVSFMIPWLYISSVLFKRPSSFILYPLSLEGIPQPAQKKQIIKHFFDSSPFTILSIKLHNLFYLVSPYQLLTSEGGQDLPRRVWGMGLFSLPGALGPGIAISAILGTLKKLSNLNFWVLSLTPILLSLMVIGWPKGLGIMHFAQASVVLLTGLGIAFLIQLKSKLWVVAVYMLGAAQLLFLLVYSYRFRIGVWFTSFSDVISLLLIICILILCGVTVIHTLRNKKSLLFG